MSTNSAVIQLQQEALDDTCSVEKLVRLAYTIAMKLDIQEMVEWCYKEMNGYSQSDNIPKYRLIYIHCWLSIDSYDRGGKVPFQEESVTLSIQELENLPQIGANYKKLEIDSHYKQELLELLNKDGLGYNLVKPSRATKMRQAIRQPLFDICKIITNSQIDGIKSQVRQHILNWAISLEKAGILGENLIFTKKEKLMSANVTYNIQSVGNMANHNQHSTIQQLSSPVQKGDFNSLESALKLQGISAEDIQELKEILDNVQQPVNELPAKVDGWLGKIGQTVNDISIQTIAGLIIACVLG